MPYLRYWLLSEEYNKKAECAAPCFFILWRFRLCFLRKTGTWRDDAFLRAAGAVAAPPAPPPGLRPCRHTPSPRAFRPQPFRTSQALSRRRFFRRGRPLGCACGPSADLAAAPSPRFRALWPRLPSPAAFLPLIPPVAPSLRYRASCRASKVTVISHILPLFFVKCLRRTFFSLRYHIIFTIICYNNQNRITVMAHSRREEGHCRKKRRNRHGKNTHCGR